MTIGFVGLGQMGTPMALRLASRNKVLVFDQNNQVCDAIANSNISSAETLTEIAALKIIFLCLPNGPVVEKVIFEEGGLLLDLQPGSIIVDTSTIEYNTSISIAQRLAERDIIFIDAPVSGMQARAEGGTLTMMCGGDQTIVDQVKPFMATMASNILFMGASGNGQLTKLINQLLFDINAAALAEILPMAVKLGLDPQKIGDVVNSGTGRSYASEFFIPNVLKGDFSQGYSMNAAYKDLVSGAEISAKYQIPTPVLAAATGTYQQALLAGHGEKDKGGMITVYENMLGVKFRAK
ncbi:MAG: NAD(P)-dependent oxidoreductase [Cohaesibacteraceae bacterium]|nr:NAD(P)-dependent oxidoreductase [Cohaesibacteraceae bacterium]